MQWVIRGAIFALSIAAIGTSAQGKPRARALGIPFEGTPGPLDAITDIAGVTVGHTTIVQGDGPLKVGRRPGADRRHGRPATRA